jgi:O-antigen/teichoic acid export membrane protein
MTVAPAPVAGNSLRVLAAQVTGNVGYFVSVLLLARALTTAGRGTVAFVTVTALLSARVVMLGAGDAAKVLAASRPHARAVVLGNLVATTLVATIAGAALIVAALALAPSARPAGVGGIELVLLALGTLAGASGVAACAFLQGTSRFREYTRVLAAAPWVYAVLLAAEWVWHGITVPGALVAWVLAQGGPTVVLWRACLRDSGLGRPERRLLRETVGFGLRAWTGGLAYLLNARVDQVIVGLIASESTLGVYAVAVNGSEVLFYVPSAVGVALLPAIAAGAEDARAERTLRVFRAMVLLTLAGIALAAVLGPVLIPLLFGPAYEASVTPFLLLLPSAIGFAANAVFSTALLACSAPGLSSLGPLVSLPVGVALDLALIPPLGASGAAIAASAALLCGGATAAVAFGARAGLGLGALVPRAGDLATLTRPLSQLRSRRTARRAGARCS